MQPTCLRHFIIGGLITAAINLAVAEGNTSATAYLVCVSNERGDSVTLLDGAAVTTSGTASILATMPVGKRPRGIEATVDGKLLYVALSGSPIQGPPQLDAQGNPILDEDDDEEESDHSKDGIGVIDLVERKALKKLDAGSDPEEFVLSRDCKRLYVANEDVATVSVLNAATGTIEAIVKVGEEPEGVNLSTDGRHIYVTCETRGEVVVIDTRTNKEAGQFQVGGRPRSTAFSPRGKRAFVPSESTGKIHVIATDGWKTEHVIDLPPGSRHMSLVMSPDGHTLYASTGRGGTVLFIDSESYQVARTVKVGQRPWGIALSPDGKLLFAANGPSNDVSVVDVERGEEVARIPTGASPWGVAVAVVAREASN